MKPITEITAHDIAKYFLSKSSMTQKKLQKLVYYSYAWFIAIHNEQAFDIRNVLFSEEPEAWVHGPVFPSLYSTYRDFNWNPIPKLKDDFIFQNENLNSFLDEIWNVFSKFDGDQLELMTHQEEPWIMAREGTDFMEPSNNKIDKTIIFNYYNSI